MARTRLHGRTQKDAPARGGRFAGRSGVLRATSLSVALLSGVALASAPVLSYTTPVAHADQRSDAQKKKEQAQRKQAELVSSLEGVSAQLGQAYLDLQSANDALEGAQSALDSAEATLAVKQREQQQANDRLAAAQSQLDKVKAESDKYTAQSQDNRAAISSMVVSTYQGDTSLSSWTYVLASDSVDELTDRASAMEVASGIQETVLSTAEAQRAQAANRTARQDAATQRVNHFKQVADSAASEAQQAASAAQSERDKVASAQSKAQAATAALEKQKAGLKAEEAQARKDEQDANSTIAQLEAANAAALAAQRAQQQQQQSHSGGGSAARPPAGSGGSGTSGGSSSSGGGGSLGGGAIGRPISGPLIVTSSFGMRFHPILHYTRLHDGVDLAASTGTPQYAAISGTATTRYDSSCGYSVFLNGVVNGDSVIIKYCHLSRQLVSSGQRVSKGQTIGLTGATGGVTGPHVHFSVRINGSFVNPMSLPGF